jgi:hypothetical protein
VLPILGADDLRPKSIDLFFVGELFFTNKFQN